MLLLTGTAHKIQVVTGSAVTGIDVHASWVDLNGTTVTPGSTNTAAITSATTTDVVASPASSTQRNVKFLSVRNTHASSSNTITVQHTDGTVVSTLIKFTLLAGYTLAYSDACGWCLTDASGGSVVTPLSGRYLGSSVLTSASANFTTQAGTNTIVIRGVGGGGGGAGCTSVASAASGGGGGGAGSYLEKSVTVTPNTAYAYTCGAGGNGQSAGAGLDGADSTFIVGATTYTATHGSGAPVATALTTLSTYKGGAGGVASTNGDLNGAGESGAPGFILIVATPIGMGGNGGSTVFGAGGIGASAAGNGVNGVKFGGGGSGAFTGASAARSGGAGGNGCWIVSEYS